MGCFNTIMVPCPKCGTKAEAQTKNGNCSMSVWELDNAPIEDIMGVNDWAPFRCEKCRTLFEVDFTVKVIHCQVVESIHATKPGMED